MCTIRRVSKEYVARKRKNRDATLNHISNNITIAFAQIDDLALKENTDVARAQVHEKIRCYQAEYAEILKDSVSHDKLTESTRKLLDQETPSKTFSKDLGSCKPRMSFTEMYTKDPNNDDVLIKDQTLVERHIYHFYHRLYQYRQCHDGIEDVKNFLSGIELKSVPEDYNAKQDCPISTQEIAQYLKTLSNNKAPGSSGITGAFYKFFWSTISHAVTLAVNYCYQIQELPSLRE